MITSIWLGILLSRLIQLLLEALSIAHCTVNKQVSDVSAENS